MSSNYPKRLSKKEFVPEDFLTRSERLSKLKIPISTDKRLIITPNKEALGFKYNCYNENMLKDKIDKKKFLSTIKKANDICENVWKRKKIEENSEYFKSNKKFLYFAILVLIISIILLIIIIYGSSNSIWLIISSFSFMGLALILSIFIMFKTIYTKPKFVILEDCIIDELGDFLNKENAFFYGIKNLEWRMQEKFYWLELLAKNEKKFPSFFNKN